jgi:hypothetical protein
MASFLAADMQTATWLSAGMGEAVFSYRATKHEAANAETEAVSEGGRCCMRARCVITEHLADRQKSPVWSTEATYPLGSAAGVWWACRKSDPRHKIWSYCQTVEMSMIMGVHVTRKLYPVL